MSIDNELVRELRSRVAQRLNQQRRRDEVSGRSPMSPEDERQFARSLIVQVLEDHARAEIASGRTPLTAEEEEHTAGAIHAALFGVGRLQPLLEDPDVENIDINGCDQVFVGYADGREERHPPVADSDEDLVELIQVLAANVGLTSRPFDSANPQLDLRLPDGSRLSAVMGVCARPSLSIRRSRLGKVFLSDLVGTGTMSEELALVPAGRGARAQEHHDRRRHQRREDHAAAGARQRDPLRSSGWSPSSGRWSSAWSTSSTCTPTWSRSRSGCRTPRARAGSRWPSWCGAACG